MVFAEEKTYLEKQWEAKREQKKQAPAKESLGNFSIEYIQNVENAGLNNDPVDATIKKMFSLYESLDGVGRPLNYLENFQVPKDSEYEAFKNFALDRISSRSNASFVITGADGVGKTSLLNTLATELSLHNYELIATDANILMSDTRSRGSESEKYMNMIELSRNHPNLIWVIDNIHSILGVGTHSESSVDFLEVMRPHIQSGQMKIIGTTTDYLYEHRLNRKFNGLLPQYRWAEPKGERLLHHLREWAKSNYGLTTEQLLSDNILKRLVNASEAYVGQPAQPSKAIVLLEPLLKKAQKDNLEVSAEMLAETLQEKLRLPEYYLYTDKLEAKLNHLRAHLDQHVVGQENVKEAIINSAYLSFSNMKAKEVPNIMLLLAGLKGQAKTAIAQAYAEYMGLEIMRFNMSTYTSVYEIDNFKRELADFLERKPYSVILFDEIEKAGKEAQRVLLDFADNGKFVISYKDMVKGDVVTKTVNARHAHVFATANAGSQEVTKMIQDANKPLGFTAKAGADLSHLESREALHEVLHRGGIEEFLLDRFEAVFVHPLAKAQVEELAIRIVEKRIQEISSRDIKVHMADRVKENLVRFVLEQNYSESMSNRTIISAIEKILGVEVAKALVSNPSELTIDFAEGKVMVQAKRELGTCKTLF